MNCKLWMIKKDAVTEERSSESEAIVALTAHAAGGDLVSDAELSSGCDEVLYIFDYVDNLKFNCVLILMLSVNVCTVYGMYNQILLLIQLNYSK